MTLPRDADQLVALREENARLQQQLEEIQQQREQQQIQQQQQQPQPQVPIVDINGHRPNVHRVAVKLPPFWSDRPSLWFAQADSQFTISDISTEVTKFHYVVSQLDARIAAEVEDIITNPPALNPYTFLRQKLIERLSSSEEQRVRQLISEEELGDRKPSQFLRHLRSLAGATVVQDNLLRQLWLQRLPSHVRAILASQSELAVEKLSELADKIIEVSPCTPTLSVNAVCNDQGTENALLNAITDLSKRVSELSTIHSRSRSFDRSQKRNKSRARESSNNSNQQTERLCWYHLKFQQNAKKCVPPCSYKGNELSST